MPQTGPSLIHIQVKQGRREARLAKCCYFSCSNKSSSRIIWHWFLSLVLSIGLTRRNSLLFPEIWTLKLLLRAPIRAIGSQALFLTNNEFADLGTINKGSWVGAVDFFEEHWLFWSFIWGSFFLPSFAFIVWCLATLDGYCTYPFL